MKLYFTPGACSLSPHIVLRELGMPVELEKVDLASKKTAKGEDFTKVNPKGYVPTLQLDDGTLLTEGPAIVQYLADRHPEAGLVPPAGTMERYRLQEWLNFVSTEMHKSYGPLFGATVPAEYKAQVAERLAHRFVFLDKHLATHAYLMGDKFSVADAYLFTVLSWSKWVKIDLSRYPNLSAYQARVAARPKVQEALKAEGLA